MTANRLIRGHRLIALLVVLLSSCAAWLSWPDPPAQAAPDPARPPLLISINATHAHGYDRLVFRFARALPGRQARYVTITSPEDSAGVGDATLLVSFSRAAGRDRQGVALYGPARRSYSLPGIISVQAVPAGRGAASFLITLARREPFTVHALRRPSRVIIAVRTPYRPVTARVFFVDQSTSAGSPAIVAVKRPVLGLGSDRAPRPARRSELAATTTLAGRALQRLFAGPTLAETARGLRFITSGATGWKGLTISNGVARIQLVGGCAANGAKATVAAEIDSTLEQFRLVKWVKIYDPAGSTEQPGGSTDSIPQCLQPVPRLWAAQVTGPVIVGLLAAAALGILLGLLLIGWSITVGLARRPDLSLPSAYRVDRIKEHPVGPGQFEPDLAWPSYPLRQMRADLARIEADRRQRYRKLWQWPGTAVVWIIFLPISAAAVVALVTAGLTSLLVSALFALFMWSCAAAAVVFASLLTLLLWGIEQAWRAVMHSEASCPRCYHVTPRPAYQCPRCGKLHRDVRPGRLGLLARRCDCGALLPTMVLRAAWHLDAVCQRCGEPLSVGSAVMRDVRIPIFGDTSAGKTRFLYAALDSLSAIASQAGTGFSFPDADSAKAAKIALDLIRSGQDTVKTSLDLPTALTCQLGSGVSATLLHLFDAAGELFRGAESHDSLSFLDHGHGLVYVLDPFAIGQVHDLVAGPPATPEALAHAATGDPETAYGEVVSRLRDSGVAAARQHLAIVISKADLTHAAGIRLPAQSAAIADWLMEHGLHNLVLSARREFAEVRYYTVASLATAEVDDEVNAGAPLRWLLSSRGTKVTGGVLATAQAQS
jgi:hypothetical protein